MDIYAARCVRDRGDTQHGAYEDRGDTQRCTDVGTQRIRNAVRTRSSRTFTKHGGYEDRGDTQHVAYVGTQSILNAVRTSRRNEYAKRCVRCDERQLRNAVRTDKNKDSEIGTDVDETDIAYNGPFRPC